MKLRSNKTLIPYVINKELNENLKELKVYVENNIEPIYHDEIQNRIIEVLDLAGEINEI